MANLSILRLWRRTVWICSVGVSAGLVIAIAAHWSPPHAANATSSTLSISGAAQLGIGLQDVYQIRLSDPAPSGGLSVSVDSNESTCVVAPTENTQGNAGTITVFVAANRTHADFVVQSTDGVPGTCNVTASASGWVDGYTSIDVVQPKLRLRELVRRIGAQAPSQPFFIDTGVPDGSGHGLRYVQGLVAGSLPLSVQVCSDTPSVGTILNRFGQDVGMDGCETNPISAPFARTVPGDFQFDPMSSSTSDVNVTASAAGFTSDSRAVTVRSLTASISGPDELGAGLQDTYAVTLSDAPTADLNITLSVASTATCAVAASDQSLASGSLTRTIPSGHRRVEFVLQGVATTMPGSPCSVSVDAGTYGTDTAEVAIVQPSLNIRELASTVGQYAPTDTFFVEIGIAGAHGRGLQRVQEWRRGLVGESPARTALSVTCTSDSPSTGTIVNSQGIDQGADGSETDLVPLAFSRTVPGNLGFDPIQGSSTPALVTCSAAGFNSDDQEVLVPSASLQLVGPELIGSRLQDDYKVNLQAAGNHDSVDVTITSLTPALCLVASTPHSTASTTITRTIGSDNSSAEFVVDALDDLTPGQFCQLQATASGYTTATLNSTIVQPGIEIRQLHRNTSVDAANDPFVVFVGVPSTNGKDLRYTQRLRQGTVNLPIKACSDHPTVARIVDELNVDNPPAGDDPAGYSCEDDTILQAFASNVPGDFQFDALTTGSTSVCVTAVGFQTTGSGCVDINVGGDSLRLITKSLIGSGLQETAEVHLSKPAPTGGASVTISADAYCLLAANDTTAGSSSPLNLTIPEGSNSATFVVSALEGLDSVSCILTATAAAYQSDSASIDVEVPGLQIADLDHRSGITAADDTFRVQIGAPSGGHLRFVQAVRIGGAAVNVTACSSDTTIGTIVGAPTNCQTKQITPGHSDVTFIFHVVGNPGPTKITVSGPGGAMDVETVRVAATAIRITGADHLGQNLQDSYRLNVSNSGGATVTVTATGDPSGACIVSSSPLVVGSASITIVIPAGSRSADFTVQALALGSCTLQASATGIPDDLFDITIVTAGLRIAGLPPTFSNQAPNNPFIVEIGPANPAIDDVESNRDNRNAILYAQPRYIGATNLLVTVCSSVAAAGQIKDPDNGMTAACADSTIYPNFSRTLEFQFDPTNTASPPNDVTNITATAATAEPTFETVTISTSGMQIGGSDTIGAGLQDDYRISLGHSAPTGGLDVTIAASPSSRCTLEKYGSAAQNPIVLHIEPGDRGGHFLLLGLASDPLYPCTLTATAGGYRNATLDVRVVDPSLHVTSLDRNLSVYDSPEQFNVQTGSRSPDNPKHFVQQAVQTATTVTACVDDTTYAQIIGGSATSDPKCRATTIAATFAETNAFSLKPKAEGSVTVTVSAPGFGSESNQVDISAASVRLTGPTQVGAGLEAHESVRLGHKAPANLLVHVCVATGSLGRCEVALHENDNGSNCVDVPIDQNHILGDLWLQGVESPASGECTLSLDAGSGYHVSTASVEIVEPGFDIQQLDSRQSTLDPNDPFIVRIGVPDSGLHHVAHEQELRYNTRSGAVVSVPVVVCSTDTTVGEVVNGTADGVDPTHCRKSQITQLNSRTSELAFDPKANGDTIVYAREVDGYTPTDDATVPVNVSDTILRINGVDDLAVGLQDDYHVALGKKAPTGGVDVTIRTLTPLTCQVASSRLASNQTELMPYPVIPAGSTRADFEVRALATGECVLQASATGFRTATKSVDVQLAALAIHHLDRSQTTGGPADRFDVNIGVPDSLLRHLKAEQELASTGTGQMIEACSSVPAVGTISGGITHPDPLKTNCRATTITAGDSSTDDFSFVVGGAGDTVITVACIDSTGAPSPNCVPIDDSTVPVHVSQAGIRINGTDYIGAGLEDDFAAVLGAAAPTAGTTVTITTTTPSRCKVSTSLIGPGYDTIYVPVAGNHTRAEFVVQAIAHEVGECIVTAAAPNYSTGSTSIDIEPSALAIHGLDASASAVGRNDPFNVDIGAARPNLTCIRSCQPVATDGGITVNVCSSDTPYGVVVGGSTGATGCRNVTIAEGQCANGQLSFDPIAAGTTVVSASSPAVDVHVDCDTITVGVRNANLSLHGPDELGIDLQDNYSLAFSGVPPIGTTATLNAYGTCVVSPTREGPPAAAVTIPMPSGHSQIDFWVEGLYPGGECTIVASSNAAGYNSDTLTIDVQTAGVEINSLDTSRSTGSSDEPFSVGIGIPTNNLHSVSPQQEVRPNSSAYPLLYANSLYGVPIKVCSSVPGVGTITGGYADSDPYCRQTTIEQLHDESNVFAFHSVSAGTTTVCVYEDGEPLTLTDNSCQDVTVAAKTMTIHGPERLGAGLQDGYTLSLSAAVTADTTFTICSLDDSVCRVAPNATSTSSTCIYPVIRSGKSRVDFYMHGLNGVTGACDLSATGGLYAPASTEINVVTPGVRIVNLDTSRSTQSSDDPFNIEIGVPSGNLSTLSYAEAARIGGGGFVFKVCSSLYLTVGSINGGDGTGCKLVPIPEGASRSGDVLFHAIGQGTTVVFVDDNGYPVIITDAGSKDVVVSATVVDLHGPDSLGAGLQDQFSIQTSAAMAADTVFTVTSTTPSLCKVSVNHGDVGVNSISLTIPKGRSRAYLYIHGMDAVTDSCEITITPPSGSPVSPGAGEVDIVQSAIRISQLAGSLKASAGDAAFIVEVGTPTSSLKSLSRVQERRAGASNFDITVCSSDPNIVKIVVGGIADTCRNVPISPNSSQTVTNAVAARPLATGTATVSAIHPDLISTDAASKDVTVSLGSLSISGVDSVGAGLEDTFTVNASPKAAADLPITLQSLTPSLCLVAKDESTVGATTYNTTIVKGHSTLKFAIQALESVTGLCTVRVSSTNTTYAGDDFNVPIVQSALRLRDLDVTTTSTSSDDSFFVDVGVPRDNVSDLKRVQAVRKGSAGLTVNVCSSVTTVGTIIGTGSDPSCKTAVISAENSGTDSGAVKFHSAGLAGTTTVYTTASGLITTDQGSLDVYVAQSALSFVATNIDHVGAGLMETFKVQSSSSVATAAVIHISSLTPTICTVAVDEVTASAGAVDVTIPAGSRSKTFEVHGLENAQGSCQLRATNVNFADGWASYDVVQAALRIDGLPSSKKTTAADDSFEVDTGVAKVNLSNLQTTQKVRFGSAGVTITVCSSDTTVGEVVRGSGSGACQSVVVAAGQSHSPTDSSNTFKFRPKGNGTTVIDASAAGFVLTDAASVDVTVSGNALSIENSSSYPVGSGLQQGTYYVLRDGSTTSAVTTTVTTLTPSVCKVAVDGNTIGGTSIALTIAVNQTQSPYFWVQGMDAIQGACQLQVTASGYTSDANSIDVVRPAIRITNLATSILPTAANDPFNIEIGIADSAQSTLAVIQPVRAGSGGIDITVLNENSAAGQLTGSDSSNVAISGQTITVRLLAGQSTNTSGALQRLEFDPNNSVTVTTGTSIDASNPNVISTTAASQSVVVQPSGGGC